MMTPAVALALLTKLAEAEAVGGRNLNYCVTGSFAFCPICGTNSMLDSKYCYAIADTRDPITKADGLLMCFYIDHPSIFRRCLFATGGAPAHGPQAEQLMAYAEALQVLNLERLNAGGKLS